MERLRREFRLRGVVQGVGFRPWAARQAAVLGLAGHVRNSPDGVEVALEGPAPAIAKWQRALAESPPPGSRIDDMALHDTACRGDLSFRIRESRTPAGAAPADGGSSFEERTRIPPDAALCPQCLGDLFDPPNRRHRYPFTHCAECGPRAAVLLGLPYDRERTTLCDFPPCAACRREYADPGDRRHHAQTIACAGCGPRLHAIDPDGTPLAGDPVEAAAHAVRGGGIVAIKGYGGFHLVCDATSAEAVERLRKRKLRPAKPLAMMVPDLQAARDLCVLDARAEALLAGPVRAVVVAPRRAGGTPAPCVAAGLAPRTDDLGLVLPYAPVHWLLFFAPATRPARDEPRFHALVFTSANQSDEPTVHDNQEAPAKLAGIADLIIEHDRAVARPNDDPVFRTSSRGPIPVRLSRASAPRALRLPRGLRDAPPLVALGGDLKCAPALVGRGEVLLAEHVGDLASADSLTSLRRLVANLASMAGITPRAVAHDLHPGYLGIALARDLGLPRVAVQHHHAHALACLLENGADLPALALILDGAGFGDDGSVWGGELLRVDGARFERVACLERVPLPGGDAAAREPWRMAAMWLDRAFPAGAPELPWRDRQADRDLSNLMRIARSGTGSPLTSSCGRLFDAVASLLDLGDRATHEGEAAMALESLAARAPEKTALHFDAPLPELAPPDAPGGPRIIPLRDLVAAVAGAIVRDDNRAVIARSFHEMLCARLAGAVAATAARTGDRFVALSGGCFQNRLLLERVCARLEEAGLAPLTHARVPPNDGGLAAGQAVAAAARLLAQTSDSG